MDNYVNAGRINHERVTPYVTPKGFVSVCKSAKSLKGMVRPAGFEPTTPRLGIWCSILLSYGRTPISYTLVEGLSIGRITVCFS